MSLNTLAYAISGMYLTTENVSECIQWMSNQPEILVGVALAIVTYLFVGGKKKAKQ